MSGQVAFINTRAPWRRALLVVALALALLGTWRGVRWLVGDTLAEFAQDYATAEAAARLAPHDPQAHLTLARLRRASFDPSDLPLALEQYERAATLDPNEWTIWLELGQARGSAGDTDGGLHALRRAAELAPAYWQPRWYLGNLLLRAGEVDAAFAELRRAANANPDLRPQVFSLAWQAFGGDMERVVKSVGGSPQARAQLVTVLVGRGRLDDARSLWSSLSEGERRENATAGEALARVFYDGRNYHAALQVLGEAGALDPSLTSAEKISNGGFEADIPPPGKKLFDWQVTPAPQAQVALDTRGAHTGGRSLRIAFNAPAHVDFRNVSQLVVVEPATRYRLSFYVRAQDLQSVSTPVLSVLDAADQSVPLAASAPVVAGTSDWQQVAVEFVSPLHSDGIVLLLTRAPCPEGACPIYGKVWYDDFDLQRSAGRGN